MGITSLNDRYAGISPDGVVTSGFSFMTRHAASGAGLNAGMGEHSWMTRSNLYSGEPAIGLFAGADSGSAVRHTGLESPDVLSEELGGRSDQWFTADTSVKPDECGFLHTLNSPVRKERAWLTEALVDVLLIRHDEVFTRHI